MWQRFETDKFLGFLLVLELVFWKKKKKTIQSPTNPSFLLPFPAPPGWVLIDRSGRHFGTILNYLRDGSVPLPESTRELGELLGEARYYLVQGLIEDCQLALQVRAVTPTFWVLVLLFLGELANS